MLSFEQKQQAVTQLRQKVERASSVILASYRGLDVQSANALRTRLHEAGPGDFEYQVVKNSILRRAAEGKPLAELAEHFQGPTALALGTGDPARLAQTLVAFAEDHEVFELKVGFVDGQVLEPAELTRLAKLPGLEELRGRIVGLLEASAQKLVGVLQAPSRDLARLASARKAKLEEEGGA